MLSPEIKTLGSHSFCYWEVEDFFVAFEYDEASFRFVVTLDCPEGTKLSVFFCLEVLLECVC